MTYKRESIIEPRYFRLPL